MINALIILLITSAIVAYLGRNKRMGFWGYFFGSILLTPIIGALLVIVSDKKKI